MKRTDRPFWAGVALGAGTVAAAVVARWWWEWHGYREEALPEWCPGIDPVGSYALPDEPVGWRLCGDYQEHFPHLRSAEPEYVAETTRHPYLRTSRWCGYRWPASATKGDGSYDPGRHTCLEDAEHDGDHTCQCGVTTGSPEPDDWDGWPTLTRAIEGSRTDGS